MPYTMENLPEGITPRDIRMVARYDRLSKLYSERATRLKDKIKAAFGPVTVVLEGIVIKTTTRKTLDAKAFEAAHPYAEFPQFYKATPVLDLSNIPKDAREGFEIEGMSTSVTVAA